MSIWSTEIKELEKLYTSFKGQMPDLEKELEHLIKTDDPVVVLVYSRRSLELIVNELCETELKRPRKTEPLKGIIDKLNSENKVPEHIITSMLNLNSLSNYGAHPKDFDPEQVKPVLNNLHVVIKWYLKYRILQDTATHKTVNEKTENQEFSAKSNPKKRKLLLVWGISILVIIVLAIVLIKLVDKFKKDADIASLEKSIAVLPFKYLSTDKEKQYQADGMMDAILLHLSKIMELTVISRTSVEQYRDTKKTMHDIGKELDVSFILEGTFQKEGDKVKLIVQLLRTENENHVWANEYNRDWKDVFEVQSEVAQAIAGELNAVISPEVKQSIEKIPTSNLTAYDFHMQALDFYNKYLFSRDRKYLEKVAQSGYQSLELDPEFALAYYWLGESSLSDKQVSGYYSPFYLDTALFFFNKALELDPTLSEAYSARGIFYNEKNQRQKAIDDLGKAISFSPNNSMGYLGLGSIYFDSNDIINALINLKKAEKLERAENGLADIYSLLSWTYLSVGDLQKAELYCYKVQQLKLILPDVELWFLEIQGKWEDLIITAEKYIALQPEDGIAYGYKAYALLGLGRFSEAENCVRKRVEYSGTNIDDAHRVGIVLWMNGKKKEAMGYFNKQISSCNESIRKKDPYWSIGGAAYDLAGVYAFLGNKKEAYKCLRELEKIGFSAGSHEYIKVDPLFKNLRNDEEFKEIVKIADEKAARIRVRISQMELQGQL